VSAKNIIMAAGSASSAAAAVFVEDVFSTWLYTGNNATRTITNGIDLSGKGGLVWFKNRLSTSAHKLIDTARGATLCLDSQSSSGQTTESTTLTSFNANGFVIGDSVFLNGSSDYASWTFRKAPKFFDVVTYTGNGSNRTIAHSLGSVPGCIIVKRTNDSADWQVYHRSNANTEYMVLNSSAAKATGTTRWNSTTPTSTEFSLGTDTTVNASGGTYVAYLFAHDAGGFGASGTDNVISCGSFTTDGSGNATVTLGYEPQWILYKRTDSAANWFMHDTMRGWVDSGSIGAAGDVQLLANLSDAETTGLARGHPTATGFTMSASNSATYIYIAIRRGPMRTPTSGTSVYYAQAIAQADTIDSTGVPFPPDLVNTFSRNGTNTVALSTAFNFVDRLRGIGVPSNTYTASGLGLTSTGTGAEFGTSAYVQLKADSQNITRGGGWNSALYGNWINYFFRRAPGFFDVVCYTGTGSNLTLNHNLGVTPELMIIKARNASSPWGVYAASEGINKTADLNRGDLGFYTETGRWLATPTATQFSVKPGGTLNSSGQTQVAYLFASRPGVSKVGSYTGNGSSQTINCGFTSGARFVLIKRTDSAGDWYVWDTARGIVAANDPHLSLNTTAAEVTSNDSIDPDNSGFIVNQVAATNVNVSGATYIFLAIA
jgi:hypothetical protein